MQSKHKKLWADINKDVIYCYNGVDIHYKFARGEGDSVNIFLHGWGRNLKDFEEIISDCQIKNYLILDFPPFGLSGQIKEWTIFTYANMVMCLCRHLKIKKCNLIGHSFGGRVAIILAASEKEFVDKIMLVGSAGMKPKKSLKVKMKIWNFKLRRKLGLNTENMGSSDYQNLNPDMKKIFTSVVGTHLEESAKLIDAKTLIIFGENDSETPAYMAKRLKKLIKNSQLIFMENCGHFCFLERKILFCDLLSTFLKED